MLVRIWLGSPDNRGDLGTRVEVVHDLGRVLQVALHPQRQGLEALGDEERVERRNCRTQVAQQLQARFQNERYVRAKCALRTEIGRVGQAVVARIWLVESGETLRVLAVIELAGVDDHATDGVAVPAQVLRGGVHDDVGAKLDRAQGVGGGDGVVDDEGNAHLVCQVGDGLDIEDVTSRVPDRLTEERLRFGRYGRAPGLDVRGVVNEGEIGRASCREGEWREGRGGTAETKRVVWCGERQ